MTESRPGAHGGRLLVYSTTVLPISQTFVADQARALRRWTPTLIGRERVIDGIRVDDLLATEIQDQSAPSSRVHGLRARVTRRNRRLEAAVARLQPDLIHAHFLPGGFDVMATLRQPECPVVVTAHGFDVTWNGSPPATLDPRLWLHGHLRRRLIRSSVHFIAVSRFIKDQLVHYGATPEDVTVHYTGVDTSYFTPPPAGAARRGILFVGRLVPKKGILDLLEAVARLRNAGIEVPVEIIGDGPLRADVQRFVARERLDVNIRGAQPREQVLRSMRASAIQCNPSRTGPDGDREGFGMVLAEAQATGLPVVASASGGMVEAVGDGLTGILVPEADPVALSAALQRCLTDADVRSRFGASARPWVVERFDLRRQSIRLEHLYDRWTEPSMDRTATPGSGFKPE